MPDNKEEYKIKKEKGKGYIWQDFRHIQKLETLAMVQIHTMSAVRNSKLILPDKKGKGGPYNTLVRKKSDMARSL